MTPIIPHSRRLLLAQIACHEAALQLSGDEQKGGVQLEKYLGLLRPALAERPKTAHLHQIGIGFDWCGAFVYYCCRQAGYSFSARPNATLPGTLAAVFIWRQWAAMPENQFIVADGQAPAQGDLVIFNQLLYTVDCDHIGIVLDVDGDHLITAEGNVENRSGIFHREIGVHINCFIRLP